MWTIQATFSLLYEKRKLGRFIISHIKPQVYILARFWFDKNRYNINRVSWKHNIACRQITWSFCKLIKNRAYQVLASGYRRIYLVDDEMHEIWIHISCLQLVPRDEFSWIFINETHCLFLFSNKTKISITMSGSKNTITYLSDIWRT